MKSLSLKTSRENKTVACIFFLPMLNHLRSGDGCVSPHELEIRDFVSSIAGWAALFQDQPGPDGPGSAVAAAVEEIDVALVTAAVLAFGGPGAC